MEELDEGELGDFMAECESVVPGQNSQSQYPIHNVFRPLKDLELQSP